MTHKTSITVALLLIGSCLPVLGAVLIAPILPAMGAHFAGVPHADILVPMAFVAPALMIAIFAPFGGMFLDKVGRKKPLLIALFFYALCGLLPVTLDSLNEILLSRIGIGAAEAVIMTCCTTLIGDYYVGRERDLILGYQTVAASVSAALFIAGGGILGEHGWRTPFDVYAIAWILLPLMAWFLREPTPAIPPLQTTEPYSLRPFAIPYALAMIAGAALLVIPTQGGYLLGKLSVTSSQQIGLVMGVNQIAVMIGAMSARFLLRFGRKALLVGAFAMGGIGLIVLGMASRYETVVVSTFVIGVACGWMLPTLLTWVMSMLVFAQRGRGAGGFTSAFFFGEFINPLIVQALSGSTGNLSGALSAFGGALLFVALCSVFIPFPSAPVPVDVTG